jgi:acyl-coenzyme A thioesterase PaaI-like protein
VCGPGNPIGLGVKFRLENDVCYGEFTPGENHVGWDDTAHGGILFSALDDVMANWLFLQGAAGVTARCEMRFRDQVKVGTPLRLEGRLIKRRGRLVELEGKALRADTGEVVVESQAKFMIVDAGPLA